MQPVLHDCYNKGCGMFYPVCEIMHVKRPLLLFGRVTHVVHVKEPLLLFGRVTHVVAAVGFLPRYLICLIPYNRK